MTEHEQAGRWDQWADEYDTFHGEMDAADVVALLTQWAPGSRVLDLGAGTGRIALPMAHAGHTVTCLDVSAQMCRVLSDKAAAESLALRAVHADMASFELGEQFDLIYCVSSTLYALLDQDDQIACLRAARAHMAPGAALVVDGFIPQAELLSRRQQTMMRSMGADSIALSAVSLEGDQRISFREITLSEKGIQLLPVETRYIWPSELRLMARLADLEVVASYGSYAAEPLTRKSTRAVLICRPSTA